MLSSIRDLTVTNDFFFCGAQRCQKNRYLRQSNPQQTPAAPQIQSSYFYSNARQRYLYLGLRNGLKIAQKKLECHEILSTT